jgi:hypothetical protein
MTEKMSIILKKHIKLIEYTSLIPSPQKKFFPKMINKPEQY